MSTLPRPRLVIRFGNAEAWELGARTFVMGVLNVTPDSFHDGGRHDRPDLALERARAMVDEGADLLDVGGESSRPGSDAVAPEEEARRVLPVIEAIKSELPVRVSVDTTKAAVAARAIAAGADMINDVSALSDPAMAAVAAEGGTPLVLMHRRGTPRTMQLDTHYDDLLAEIAAHLRAAVEKALAAGVGDDKILLDPGIGFGKATSGNLRILRELATLSSLGRPIVVGASRKSFIGAVLDLPVEKRLEGSLAAAALAAWQGAHVIRAHDVVETVRVVRMIDAIRNG